ncbi:DMP19 family protein [Pedobacter nutrimenti]|uniref:DNA mimic protein DMP19 C-terminal domain-containing protein n=1 Tax=Pedobacter nutrimenti TaxID=1241337 RepID=A0A318UJD1_9SPHI|nr:hypothetical protein [Pedobacter nutrimenti]PYF74055.1 hypothetical protein B0O44_104226 [Pedobacter nutrimenti]
MRFLLFITILFLAGKTQGQVPGFTEPTPREELIIKLANECFNTSKYKPIQRLAIYPFNKVSSIKLISFKEDDLIPVHKKRIDNSKVLESCTLNTVQTNELTEILYNIGYNPDIKPILRLLSNYKCYEPRNGILFLDAAGKAFEFIEICFECHRTRASSKKVVQGIFCEDKFSLLKNFFQQAGIQYGTSSLYTKTAYSEILKLDTNDVLRAFQEKLDNKVLHGDNIEQLSDLEKKIFILLNSREIYDGYSGNSGLASFYFKYTGRFYPQTIDLLSEIGARRTLEAFKSSMQQWPEGIIPENRANRLKVLLKIADQAIPIWQGIEKELYTYESSEASQVLTQKENLKGLIFNYIMSHKNELSD